MANLLDEIAKLPTVAEDPSAETPLCPHCDVRTYIPYPHVRACLKCSRAYRIEEPCPQARHESASVSLSGPT